MIALYRPGPMEHIPTYIKAKKGRGTDTLSPPGFELNTLEETYGVIVYQDQILFIVRQFAGYTMGQKQHFP